MDEDQYLNNNYSTTKNDFMLARSYNIKEFDPNCFKELTGGVCVIVSPTGAGKTVLLKHILSVIGPSFDNHFMMSKTATLQETYDFYPRELISDFDEEKLGQIWNSQKSDPSKKFLIVMDDIIASPEYKKSKILKDIAFGGRHLGILVIILSQSFIGITTDLRRNTRIAISFALSSKKETEKFVEQYMATVSNRSGYLLFKRITEKKYRAVIVCNYKVGEKVEERVYQFTADPDAVVDFFAQRKKPKKVTKADLVELKKEYTCRTLTYKF